MDIKVGDIKNRKGIKSKVTDIDPETGSITWSIQNSPDIDSTFNSFIKLLNYLKNITQTLDDTTINDIYRDLRVTFNKFRTHLRKNYPEQYQKLIQEISTSNAAGGYNSKYAFKLGPGPKAGKDGVKDNTYVKSFGYKLVDRKKQAKKSKTTDYVDLWNNTYS